MRKSVAFIYLTALLLGTCCFLAFHGKVSRQASASEVAERVELVKRLRLTDLCLFTEARYTRNPSMADRFSAFQDHPTALEHFPSGSLILPPKMVSHATTP